MTDDPPVSDGEASSFIHMVNCGRCHAWNNTNELAKSLVGFSDTWTNSRALKMVCPVAAGKFSPKAQAVWDELDELPYLNLEHEAAHQWAKEDAFDQANHDMNARLHTEHRERLNG